MSSFRVQFTFQRIVTCYLEAELEEDVHGFLEANPEWRPGDVPGLIEVIGDEVEVDCTVADEETIVPLYRVTAALEIEEYDQ